MTNKNKLILSFFFILCAFPTMALGSVNNYYYDHKIDKVIQEALNECSNLKNDNCISVISTIDQICQVAYFPNCFNDQWLEFTQYKTQLIKNGHLTDYEDDQYYTLNNDHFGNSEMTAQK